MDWQPLIDSATGNITTAGSYAIAGGLVVIGMVAGYRFVIKAINRAVGK